MLPTQLQGGDSCTRDVARLEAILERDIAAGGLVLGLRGKINIKHYTAEFGCSAHHFEKRGLRQVVDRYQVEVGANCNNEVKLPAMRNWIEDRMSEGTLRIRDNKIDRKEVCQVFGISSSLLFVRSEKMRDMFYSFDAMVASGQYIPTDLREKLQRVEVVLAGACPLDKNGLTISRKQLAAETDIVESHLYLLPFKSIISRKEQLIREDALVSKVYPLLGKRRYNFEELIPVWGRGFCERIVVGFVEFASTISEEMLRRRQFILLDVFNFIGSSTSPDCLAVVEAATRGKVIPQGHWENALWEWRNALIENVDARLKETSITVYIGVARQVFDAFSAKRIVPYVRNPLTGKKNAVRKGGKRKTVAEVNEVPADAADNDSRARYVDFAQDQLAGMAKKFAIHISGEESSAFLSVLDAELRRDEQPSADPALAILAIINRRLDAIYRMAEQKYLYWRAHYDAGEAIVKRANIDPDEFFEKYVLLNNHNKGKALRPYFPNERGQKNDEKRYLGIANMITIAIMRYDGLMPDKNSVETEGLGSFFEQRYKFIGGKVSLDAYINPHPDGVAAALTLYLLASGANLAVGRTLNLDCTEPSDLPGHTRITGFKARAKGKPIIADLPSKSVAVEAIEWIASSARFARTAANLNVGTKEERDPLFVARVKGEYKLIEPFWYTSWFKENISSVEELAGLGIVPSMIRPSILLRAALENDGRLQVGAAIGQHTAQISAGYQVRWPIRLLYDRRIKEFADSFEALVTRNIDAAAAKLGIGPEVFVKRLENLAQTGLGTFCADSRGRPEVEGDKCRTLDCWNDCPHLIIIAEVEAISLLQLWQHSLRLAQGEWERDQPQRWEQVYLPWLCLTDVVEEKMRSGPARKIWKEAKSLTDRRISDPAYPLPRPL